MKLFSKDLDLVLAAPAPCIAHMAQELLASHGVPSLLHGRPHMGQFGFERASPFIGPDVYVPRGARRVAQRILREAWDPDALAELEFPSTLP